MGISYMFYLVICFIDRLIHNVEVHTGAIGVCPNQPDLKASGNTVLALLQHIPSGDISAINYTLTTGTQVLMW